MIIEVKKIPEGETHFEETLLLTEELSDVGRVKDNIPAEITITRSGADLLVTVCYRAEVTEECGRCLNDFSISVEGSVSFRIVPHDRDEDDDLLDIYTYISEADSIEYSQTLYDDIMTQLPSKPLCREECKGIIISSDSVTVVIEEEEKEVDPRWAALKKLKN